MNSAVYCETLKKLRRAIQEARNAGCHQPFFCFTVTLDRTLLLKLKTSSPYLGGNKWTTPPYSPDLTPSYFHLFLRLKKFLGGKRFDDDLKDAEQNNNNILYETLLDLFTAKQYLLSE
jgi:hypothetical protein